MTSLESPEAETHSIANGLPPAKAAAALALAALADWLFYDQNAGLSVVLFAFALAGVSLAANFGHVARHRLPIAGAIVVAGLLPALEEVNAVSLAFAILALGTALALTTNPCLNSVTRGAASLVDLLLVSPFRLFRDVVSAFDLPGLTRGFILWFVPLLLGTVFVFLFVAANPVLEIWISQLNPGNPAASLSLGRTLFWILVLALVWPFVHVKWRRYTNVAASGPRSSAQGPAEPDHFIDLLGAGTILRSLILFNLLFSIQTILDAIYLWGNTTLPAAITYASYAHRGAYPLIVTALLAAAFVLVAMRPGGPAEQSRVIRPLVYLWVGQNVLLVISSMLRLDLYVQTYLLTYWRVAAFVWMLLVAVGLILILVRIALRASNEWLVRGNLLVLTIVLYVGSLINFAAVVADYNVSHSREASGSAVSLDMDYLIQLGPNALPAIDQAIQLRYANPVLVSRRNSLVEQQRQQMASWRGWSFRGWRLQRFLDGRQSNAPG
ncbi:MULTISPECIES: DUF4173 domain-containing protein [unclassified Bradyrhizobium]|uniref:DUF4153 domain-containing protein n=1 Tax=unclassified Bradyrhizobium TaxID=2631580 RepID=UPI001BAE3DEF|nr:MULTISPECIES: DUF4173 domain-containing protein [unclassified Bradyrhizobium]MBR1203863.1 DUF4173 domain-containing protein [Bradyrhizobium sp. AUGA SZCCT0124]MBR1310250.1 DUF4173 domain-containing protein [Bradyrhizobium sp. AUGA SZCCT0051]MBR1340392.1 DUF4173 domain-containing protein [Bradyrhizobium sp. AUGA SZCCT0105]MBR1354999.1 DUF4173 domain-containing protein [Bradyrhizobium sp. AUGA SZCCT0045]